MLDTISQYAMEILSISFSGISLGSILFMSIYTIIQSRRNRTELLKSKKSIELSDEKVESAFKNAILPSKIKLDISGKITQPLEDGFNKIKSELTAKYEEMEKGMHMILAILSKFNHIAQLSDSEKDELQDLLGNTVVVEEKL